MSDLVAMRPTVAYLCMIVLVTLAAIATAIAVCSLLRWRRAMRELPRRWNARESAWPKHSEQAPTNVSLATLNGDRPNFMLTPTAAAVHVQLPSFASAGANTLQALAYRGTTGTCIAAVWLEHQHLRSYALPGLELCEAVTDHQNAYGNTNFHDACFVAQ